MLETPQLPRDIDYDYVYDPSEDTFLLMDCLEKDYNDKILGQGTGATLSLEIGSGSGMISSFIHKNGLFGRNNIHLSSDINPIAIAESVKTMHLNVTDKKALKQYDALLMNLFDGVRNNTIDYFVFNPPYVPSEKVPGTDELLNVALEGGVDGMEVTSVLLSNIASKLSDTGIGYILFCAQNKPDAVMERFNGLENGLVMELVEKRKCGWEVLSVYRFWHKPEQKTGT